MQLQFEKRIDLDRRETDHADRGQGGFPFKRSDLYFRPSSFTPVTFFGLPFSVIVTSCSLKILRANFHVAFARLEDPRMMRITSSR